MKLTGIKKSNLESFKIFIFIIYIYYYITPEKWNEEKYDAKVL